MEYLNKLKDIYKLSPLSYVIEDKASYTFWNKDKIITIIIFDKTIFSKLNAKKNKNINIKFNNNTYDVEIFLWFPFIKENIDINKSLLMSNFNAWTRKELINLIDILIKKNTENNSYIINHDELKNIFFKDFNNKWENLNDLISYIETNHINKSIYKHKTNYLNFLDTWDELINLFPSLINSFLNQNLTTCETDSPSATYMEISLLVMIRKLIWFGWDYSKVKKVYDIWWCFTVWWMMGNIIWILTARNTKYKDIQKKWIYSLQKKLYLIVWSSHTHYSNWTWFWWLGFWEENVVFVKSIKWSIDLDDLNKKIDYIYSVWWEILSIVCTLWNPYSMNFDNIDWILEIWKKYDIWTHCDAANWWILIFSNKYKKLISKIKNFNSVSLDFHKALWLNYSTSIFMCNEINNFSTNISEWNIINKPNSMDLWITTPFVNSRWFDSFKLWFYIKYYWLDYIWYKIDAKIEHIKNFFNILSFSKNIVELTVPDSFGLVFIYIPTSDIDNYKNWLLDSKIISEYQVWFKNSLFMHTWIDINIYDLSFDIFWWINSSLFAKVLSIHNSHENIWYELYYKLNNFLITKI